MANQPDNLYITYVEGFKEFLKIWGQPNRTCATYIEKQLIQLIPEFNRTAGPSPNSVGTGMFCFAKYIDDNYYRAKIISNVYIDSVIVHFIDYGNKERVQLSNVRILNNQANEVVSKIVAQAEEFYLDGVVSSGCWTPDVISQVRRDLCFEEYNYRTVFHLGNERLIQIKYHGEDYATILHKKGLARSISLQEEIILLRNTEKNQQQDLQQAYNNLNVNMTYNHKSGYPVPLEQGIKNGQNQTRPPSQPKPTPVSQYTLPQANMGQIYAPGINNNPYAKNEEYGIMNTQKMSPTQVYNSTCNPNINMVHTEPKLSPTVVNNSIMEELANQLTQHLMKKNLNAVVPEAESHGYVTQVLEVGTTHNVYISYIDDGPWSFSVQLVSNKHELNQLTDDLKSCELLPVKLPVVLGHPCIAKSKQSGYYCRGVVVNIAHSAVKVFFVDFGNAEDLPVSSVFQLPPKFFKVKVMSQKFALSGLQRIKPFDEIKKAFVEVVEKELLLLRVTALEGENLPTCDLYLKNVNIKRILNNKVLQNKKWDAPQLPQPGDTELVLITWIDSLQKFYVQLKKNEKDLLSLTDELEKWHNSGELFSPSELVPGALCVCKFTGDKKWYRAIITTVNSKKSVTVFYVDYGNTEVVSTDVIKKIGSGIVRQMNMQAIQCCLCGFESRTSEPGLNSALNFFLEKEVLLRVVSRENNRIIVRLYDGAKEINPSLTTKLLPEQSVTMRDVKFIDKYDKKIENFRNKNDEKSRSHISNRCSAESYASGWKKTDDKNPRKDGGGSELLKWRSSENRQNRERSKEGGKDLREKLWEESEKLSWRSGEENKKETGGKARSDCRKDSILKASKKETIHGSRTERNNVLQKKSVTEEKKGTGIQSKVKAEKKVQKGSNGCEGQNQNIIDKNKTYKSVQQSLSIQDNEISGDKNTGKEQGEFKRDAAAPTRFPVKLDAIALNATFKEQNVEQNSVHEVIVTHFVNPNEVHVQLLSKSEEFKKLMNEIQYYYSTKLPIVTLPKKEDVVVAKFKEDYVLYRAVVMETSPLIVRYIDFGNEEQTEKSMLWLMDKKFLELEAQSLKCSLLGVKPLGDRWPKDDSELNKVFEREKYICTFRGHEDQVHKVNLATEDGIDIGEELIRLGFALTSDVEININNNNNNNKNPVIKCSPLDFDLMWNETFSVYISHIVDAMEFHVQVAGNSVGVIESNIRDYIKSEKWTSTDHAWSLSVDILCLVCGRDGDWFRAKIMEVHENDALVKLIDYGNTLKVSKQQIMSIPDDLAEHSPQAVPCSLYCDAEIFPDETLQGFKNCCKKYFVAFVHDVINNRLKITLYDSNGKKLEFMNSLNNAATEIEPINVVPFVNQKLLVCPSHIESPKEIYLHRMCDITSLEELNARMFEYYSESSDNLDKNVEEFVNQVCAAKSVTDDFWYRARVAVLGKDSARVLFIDFGNTEEVPLNNLRKLDPTFLVGYSYAKKVSLNLEYDDDFLGEIIDKLSNLISMKECIGYFMKVEDVLYTELIVEGKSVTNQLISEKTTKLSEAMFNNVIYEIGRKAFISYVKSTKEFWVHKESISNELYNFQDKIQIACKNGSPKKYIAEGDIVGAMYSDGLWYRARVISIEMNIVSVQFIDYGNALSVDINKIIELDEKFLEQPPFVIFCSLKGNWEESATGRFVEIIANSQDPFTMVELEDGNPKVVDLLYDGTSITEKLMSEGYFYQKEEKKELDLVRIIHSNSPDDFFILKKNDFVLFENVIMKGLSNADEFEDESDPKINEVYCVKNTEDGKWHRAKVVKSNCGDILVEFIDHGNKINVSSVKVLPPELRKLPALALNCCLVYGTSIDTWSKAATDTFSEYVTDQDLKMEVVLERAQKSFVRLSTMDGKCITEILSTLCQKDDRVNVLITHINSITDFYVQRVDEPELDSISKHLSSGDNFEKLTTYNQWASCAAKNTDGNWCRAEIRNICDDVNEVFLIDYGSLCFSEDLRQLPENLKGIKPLAKNCSLNFSLKNVPESVKEEFISLAGEQDMVFRSRIIKPGVKDNVSLMRDGKKLEDILLYGLSENNELYNINTDFVESDKGSYVDSVQNYENVEDDARVANLIRNETDEEKRVKITIVVENTEGFKCDDEKGIIDNGAHGSAFNVPDNELFEEIVYESAYESAGEIRVDPKAKVMNTLNGFSDYEDSLIMQSDCAYSETKSSDNRSTDESFKSGSSFSNETLLDPHCDNNCKVSLNRKIVPGKTVLTTDIRKSDISKCKEQIIPGSISCVESIYVEEPKTRSKKLSESGRTIRSGISRGQSVEEISTTKNLEPTLSKGYSSSSAPGTPIFGRRHQKNEYQDKLLPECISHEKAIETYKEEKIRREKTISGTSKNI